MTIKEEEVDEVMIEPYRLQQQGYLEAMIECLRKKHELQIKHQAEQPLFYLEIGSKMNNAGYDEGS